MKKKTILAFFCFHWIFKYLEIKTNLTIFIDQIVKTSLTFHNLSDLLTAIYSVLFSHFPMSPLLFDHTIYDVYHW